MEDGDKPQLWPPEGAAPAVATEEDGNTQDPVPAEETSADLDPVTVEETRSDLDPVAEAAPEPDITEHTAAFPTGAVSFGEAAATTAEPGLDDDLDPVSYGEDGSYVYEDSTPSFTASTPSLTTSTSSFADGRPSYGDSSGYLAGSRPPAGYNFGMSPSADEPASVPPYPAELPSHLGTAPASPPPAAAAFPGAGRPAPAKARTQTGGRRASLVLDRLEPWSVMKFSFLMSLVAFVVLFIAVALLYFMLDSLGVFTSIGQTLSSVTSSQGSGGVNIARWTSASRVLGYTMLVGAVDVVVITALSTVGAMVYNLVSHLGGGIEVTLKEAD